MRQSSPAIAWWPLHFSLGASKDLGYALHSCVRVLSLNLLSCATGTQPCGHLRGAISDFFDL